MLFVSPVLQLLIYWWIIKKNRARKLPINKWKMKNQCLFLELCIFSLSAREPPSLLPMASVYRLSVIPVGRVFCTPYIYTHPLFQLPSTGNYLHVITFLAFRFRHVFFVELLLDIFSSQFTKLTNKQHNNYPRNARVISATNNKTRLFSNCEESI